jgi:hypothetical protein
MHRDRGYILKLKARAGRQLYAQLLQHVAKCLHREGGLTGLITRTVETDDKAITNQLVRTDACNIGEVFQTLR